jgi:hypothetical protein
VCYSLSTVDVSPTSSLLLSAAEWCVWVRALVSVCLRIVSFALEDKHPFLRCLLKSDFPTNRHVPLFLSICSVQEAGSAIGTLLSLRGTSLHTKGGKCCFAAFFWTVIFTAYKQDE